jgi:hypothetical protein
MADHRRRAWAHHRRSLERCPSDRPPRLIRETEAPWNQGMARARQSTSWCSDPLTERLKVPPTDGELRAAETMTDEQRAQRREEIARKRRENALAKNAAMQTEEVEYPVPDSMKPCSQCGSVHSRDASEDSRLHPWCARGGRIHRIQQTSPIPGAVCAADVGATSEDECSRRAPPAHPRTLTARHNCLFFGHPRAGRNFAGLYSLVESCIANDVEPTEYLTDVLPRIRDATNDEQLDALLPDRWHPVGPAP